MSWISNCRSCGRELKWNPMFKHGNQHVMRERVKADCCGVSYFSDVEEFLSDHLTD